MTLTAPPTTPVHAMGVDDVVAAFDVDPGVGLSSDEVASRRREHGPNELAEAERTSAWRRFAHQFRELLILVLLAAAAVSFLVSGELKTPIVVLVVVVLNAIIGFVQENRAEASLDALRRMLVLEVRVRRDGHMVTVPAGELVPGDVVAVEAGDRIPADGRVIEAVNLEVEEAALTGESMPVAEAGGSRRRSRSRGGRPDLDGPHADDRHPWPWRARRHVHRDGHRDRPASPDCSATHPPSARRCSTSSTGWRARWPCWPA